MGQRRNARKGEGKGIKPTTHFQETEPAITHPTIRAALLVRWAINLRQFDYLVGAKGAPHPEAFGGKKNEGIR